MINDSAKRLADHPSTGNVAQSVRKLDHFGRIVSRKLHDGEPAERCHIIGPARQDLVVHRNRALGLRTTHKPIGPDLQIALGQAAGTLEVRLGLLGVIEPAQSCAARSAASRLHGCRSR